MPQNEPHSSLWKGIKVLFVSLLSMFLHIYIKNKQQLGYLYKNLLKQKAFAFSKPISYGMIAPTASSHDLFQIMLHFSALCRHTGFIAVVASINKSSFWPLAAELYRRCLNTPSNSGTRRLTVTPQMASLYSSSFMPLLSPWWWYPAWGKKWSVTVTQWAISWLQAEPGTQRAVCLSKWLMEEEPQAGHM